MNCREGVVLVCTDAAARGLDIPGITHVVQAEFAPSAVDFIHRVSILTPLPWVLRNPSGAALDLWQGSHNKIRSLEKEGGGVPECTQEGCLLPDKFTCFQLLPVMFCLVSGFGGTSFPAERSKLRLGMLNRSRVKNAPTLLPPSFDQAVTVCRWGALGGQASLAG